MASLTIGVPTTSYSSYRLPAFFKQMREFARMPFEMMLCDEKLLLENADETNKLNEEIEKKKEICKKYDVKYIQNPNPDLSENLNQIFRNTETDWVGVIEDGVLPQEQWLAPVVKLIDEYGDKDIQTPRGSVHLGMLAWPHYEATFLGGIGLIPTTIDPELWLTSYDIDSTRIESWKKIIADFYKDEASWNKGDLTYDRIFEAVKKYPEGEAIYAKHVNNPFRVIGDYKSVDDGHLARLKKIGLAWWPGGLICVSRKLWEKARGFYPGFNCYEAWMGTQCAIHNCVSITVPTRPFIHLRSQGFMSRTMHTERWAKNRLPRADEDRVFESRFGLNRNDMGVKITGDYLPGLGDVIEPWNETIKDYVKEYL